MASVWHRRAYYERALKLEPQMLINALVKQITLYYDKMIIAYNSPVSAGPDKSRNFSFYEKQLKMPYVIQNRENYGAKEILLIMHI